MTSTFNFHLLFFCIVCQGMYAKDPLYPNTANDSASNVISEVDLSGITAGFSAVKFNYKYVYEYSQKYYWATADYLFTNGFTLGYFYDHNLKNHGDRNWFSNTIYFHQIRCEGTFDTLYGDIEQHADIEINDLEVKLNTEFRFQNERQRLKEFFAVGVTNSFSIYHYSQTRFNTYDDATGAYSTDYRINDIPKKRYHAGLIARLGVNYYNQWMLSAAMERGFATEDNPTIRTAEYDFYLSFYLVLR